MPTNDERDAHAILSTAGISTDGMSREDLIWAAVMLMTDHDNIVPRLDPNRADKCNISSDEVLAVLRKMSPPELEKLRRNTPRKMGDPWQS